MSIYRRRKRRRPSGAAIIAILICAALAYAGVLLGVRAIGNRIEGDPAAEPVGSLDGRFGTDDLKLQYADRTWRYRKQDLTNILLIGIDWESGEDEVSGRYAGQADFIGLLTMDKRNKTVSMLQVDRDTIADIRIYGPFGDYTGVQQTQICLSHAYGTSAAENCENTLWAVSRLLGGIPIDGYMALDMGGITALNDALGGVTVTLEDDFSALDPEMRKGAAITLRGRQAEYFVRGRMNVGDGTNASRMRRQQAFIRGAEELIRQGMKEDMNYIGKLYDALDGHVQTDIERGWLINRAYACRDYQIPDVKTLAGSRVIGEDGFVEFHADADALSDMLATEFFE